MPKILPFEEIKKNKKYEYEARVKRYVYDYRIQVPAKLGRIVLGKKIKVTIEVLDDLSTDKEKIKEEIEKIKYVRNVEIGEDRFIIYTEGEDYDEDKFLKIQEEFEKKFIEKFKISPEPDDYEITRWDVKFDKFLYN